jgi:hypothetical protein
MAKGEQFGDLVKCDGCDAKILWAKTAEGKEIPLHPRPPTYRVRLGALGPIAEKTTEDEPVYVSHFATCPNASKFSSSRKGGGS